MGQVFPLVAGTTGTSGTGAFTVTAVANYLAWSTIANGTVVDYHRKDSTPNYEEGEATVNTSAGVTTLTRVGSPFASSNGGAAVNWAPGGTQTVNCSPLASQHLGRKNNGSDILSASAWRTSLGLGSAALITSEQAGVVTSGWSGGTDGKVVRCSAASTFVDAANTDTVDQLFCIAVKVAGVYYLPGCLVPGLSSLTVGVPYYLSTAGGITTTRPTESATVRVLPLGWAPTTTTLVFRPVILLTK